MKRAARTDTNQAEVVAALRKADCTVQHLHTLGQGTPDLLVGFAGQNFLLELKDGNKPPSKRRLTPDETAWHQSWAWQVNVVSSSVEALQALGFDATSLGH